MQLSGRCTKHVVFEILLMFIGHGLFDMAEKCFEKDAGMDWYGTCEQAGRMVCKRMSLVVFIHHRHMHSESETKLPNKSTEMPERQTGG